MGQASRAGCREQGGRRPDQRRAASRWPSCGGRTGGCGRTGGDPEVGVGFLRRGDPVNCYPFIDAEKAQRRNVKRACELLKVSRAACHASRADQTRTGTGRRGGGRRPPSQTRPPPPGRTRSAGTSPPTPPRSTPGGAATSPASPPGRAGCTWPRRHRHRLPPRRLVRPVSTANFLMAMDKLIATAGLDGSGRAPRILERQTARDNQRQ